MVATVSHATVIQKLVSKVEVKPFSNYELTKLEQVPLIDAGLDYKCHYTMKTYLMIAGKTIVTEAILT